MTILNKLASNKNRTVALTICLGILGAFLANALGAPAPWLTGPALIVTLTALCNIEMRVPFILRDGCFVIIGMTLGAGVTPEAIDTARQWPITIITLSIGLLLIILFSSLCLQKLFKFDRVTALLSSMPGHLSYVLSLSSDTSADLATVSIVQSLRVLILTLAVPVLIVLVEPDGLTIAPRAIFYMSLKAHLLIGIGALVAGAIFKKLNVPAALLLGGMAVSAFFHATNLIQETVTPWLSMPAFILMGTIIGTRFSNIRWAQVSKAFWASLVVTGTAILVTIVGAYLMVFTTGLPLSHVLIAFAPGGLETMAAMGTLMGANPAFIAAHHTSRLLFLTLIIPFIMAFATRDATPKIKPE